MLAWLEPPEAFLWARTNVGSGSGNRLVRYTLKGGKLDSAAGSMSFISTAWANETLGAVTTSVSGGSESADSTKPGACTDGAVRYCDIVLTGPLSFGPTP